MAVIMYGMCTHCNHRGEPKVCSNERMFLLWHYQPQVLGWEGEVAWCRGYRARVDYPMPNKPTPRLARLRRAKTTRQLLRFLEGMKREREPDEGWSVLTVSKWLANYPDRSPKRKSTPYHRSSPPSPASSSS